MGRSDFGSRRGAVAVEFAIALPLVLLFVIGLLEFGRLIWMKTTLDYAVEAAARCAAIDAALCGSAGETESFAVSAAAGLPVDAGNFAVAEAQCGVLVSGSMPFSFAVPALFPFSLTLSAEDCYPH